MAAAAAGIHKRWRAEGANRIRHCTDGNSPRKEGDTDTLQWAGGVQETPEGALPSACVERQTNPERDEDAAREAIQGAHDRRALQPADQRP